MTTSNQQPQEAYIWIWLPNTTEPVVAGKLQLKDQQYVFNYGLCT
jgi:serine/threonine-protein kinase HipA